MAATWNGVEVTDEEYERLMRELMERVEAEQVAARAVEDELARTGPFDPVSAINAILDARPDIVEGMPDEHLARMAPYLDQWAEGVTYAVGDLVGYGDRAYRCLQAHESSEAWNPEAAVSLWAKVLIPDPSVIPEWEQPGSTNPYMRGDRVRHVGRVWESLVDNNVWEPGTAGTEALWAEVTG